jgi:transposase
MQQRKHYPSDVSREQFERIRPLLEAARKHTKPRRLDLYEVFCGVLYVLRGGIQCRMLPQGFPKWRAVYSYWQIWDEPIARHQAAIAPVHKPLPASALSDPTTTLDQVLKKIGWRHPTKPWAQNQDQPVYH